MITVRGIEDLRGNLAIARKAGHTIALVPTMGCLHEGHRSLIAVARERCDYVALSIFVNPLQFGPAEDFASYPRPLEDDIAVCRRDAVSLLFVPEAESLYAPDHSVAIEERSLSKGLCGAGRPGHFRGVATVVAKLFNLVQPDIAVFGEKDAQQTAVIKRMVRDLNIPVTIVDAPTIREQDGLAVSSRNRLLGADARRRAAVIYRALREAADAYHEGERDAARVCGDIVAKIESQPSFRVEYAEAVDDQTLEPASCLRDNVLLMVAVKSGNVRLIDNLRLA